MRASRHSRVGYESDLGYRWTSVIQHAPRNFISGQVDRLTMVFDRPMDTLSFADDIVKFTGPAGNLQATGFDWTDSRTLEVTFASQTALY